MKMMSHYLIIMLLIMLFIFRIIVVFTTTMGIDFMVKSINVNFEIALLFIMLISIILMTRSKLSGAVILLIASSAYYGPDLFNRIINLYGQISIENATEMFASAVSIIIPIVGFFIIAFAKEQEKRPVDKKTDFFYKNDNYDRKYDERADKNNYRTL